MKTITLAVLLSTLTASFAPAQSGCGLLPLKPLPPLGCKDLKPVCQCDKDGRNCAWRWNCVK